MVLTAPTSKGYCGDCCYHVDGNIRYLTQRTGTLEGASVLVEVGRDEMGGDGEQYTPHLGHRRSLILSAFPFLERILAVQVPHSSSEAAAGAAWSPSPCPPLLPGPAAASGMQALQLAQWAGRTAGRLPYRAGQNEQRGA